MPNPEISSSVRVRSDQIPGDIAGVTQQLRTGFASMTPIPVAFMADPASLQAIAASITASMGGMNVGAGGAGAGVGGVNPGSSQYAQNQAYWQNTITVQLEGIALAQGSYLQSMRAAASSAGMLAANVSNLAAQSSAGVGQTIVGGGGGASPTFGAFNAATGQTVPLAFNPGDGTFFNTQTGMGMAGVGWPGAAGGGGVGGGSRGAFGAGGLGRYLTAGFALRALASGLEENRRENIAGMLTGGDPTKEAENSINNDVEGGAIGKIPILGELGKFFRDPSGAQEGMARQGLVDAKTIDEQTEANNVAANYRRTSDQQAILDSTEGDLEKKKQALSDKYENIRVANQKAFDDEQGPALKRHQEALKELEPIQNPLTIQDLIRNASLDLVGTSLRNQEGDRYNAEERDRRRKYGISGEPGEVNSIAGLTTDQKQAKVHEQAVLDAERVRMESETSDKILGIQISASESALRARGQSYEADKLAFNTASDARIAKAEEEARFLEKTQGDSVEARQARRVADATAISERGQQSYEAERHFRQTTETLSDKTLEAQYNAIGQPRQAQLTALLSEIRQTARDAGDDPALQAQAEQYAQAKLEEFKHEGSHFSKGTDDSEREEFQKKIFENGGGANATANYVQRLIAAQGVGGRQPPVLPLNRGPGPNGPMTPAERIAAGRAEAERRKAEADARGARAEHDIAPWATGHKDYPFRSTQGNSPNDTNDPRFKPSGNVLPPVPGDASDPRNAGAMGHADLSGLPGVSQGNGAGSDPTSEAIGQIRDAILGAAGLYVLRDT